MTVKINPSEVINEARQGNFWYKEVKSLGKYIDTIALNLLFPKKNKVVRSEDIREDSDKIFDWLSESYEENQEAFFALLVKRKKGIDPVWNKAQLCEAWKKQDCENFCAWLTLEDAEEVFPCAGEDLLYKCQSNMETWLLAEIEDALYEPDFRIFQLILLVEERHTPIL